MVDKRPVPFLTTSKNGQLFVLNSHTFSDADFEAVGEVLLSPMELGLLDLPGDWIEVIRDVFNSNLKVRLQAPSRVSMQILENGDIILHNYNKENIDLTLSSDEFKSGMFNAFEKQELTLDNKTLSVHLKPRSRIWLQKIK